VEIIRRSRFDRVSEQSNTAAELVIVKDPMLGASTEESVILEFAALQICCAADVF